MHNALWPRPIFSSSDKIFTLYEDLHSSEAPEHLVSQYEEVISALMDDVKKMETETKRMEEKFAKERESHTQHLRNIEAELDAQGRGDIHRL